MDNTGKQCLISNPFLSGPSFCEAEVTLGDPQIHTLGLVECIASRLNSQLNLSFNGASRAQFTRSNLSRMSTSAALMSLFTIAASSGTFSSPSGSE